MKSKKIKILITGGATWVKIDQVRIFTNRFTGKTALQIAKYLAKKNTQLTLLINPHCLGKINLNCRKLFFYYYEDFIKQLKETLSKNKFDAIIHTAAVSDYILKKQYKGKIPSGKGKISFTFYPAIKAPQLIRKYCPESCCVQFKLEAKNRGLFSQAYRSLHANKFDYVVANSLEDLTTKYIIDQQGKIYCKTTLEKLPSNIWQLIISNKKTLPSN